MKPTRMTTGLVLPAFLTAALLCFLTVSSLHASPKELLPEEDQESEKSLNRSSVEPKIKDSEEKEAAEMGKDPRRERFLMELRKLYPQDWLPANLKKK